MYRRTEIATAWYDRFLNGRITNPVQHGLRLITAHNDPDDNSLRCPNIFVVAGTSVIVTNDLLGHQDSSLSFIESNVAAHGLTYKEALCERKGTKLGEI